VGGAVAASERARPRRRGQRAGSASGRIRVCFVEMGEPVVRQRGARATATCREIRMKPEARPAGRSSASRRAGRPRAVDRARCGRPGVPRASRGRVTPSPASADAEAATPPRPAHARRRSRPAVRRGAFPRSRPRGLLGLLVRQPGPRGRQAPSGARCRALPRPRVALDTARQVARIRRPARARAPFSRAGRGARAGRARARSIPRRHEHDAQAVVEAPGLERSAAPFVRI